MSPTTLHLAVQYATQVGVPARGQVRRWVRAALSAAPDLDHRAVDSAALTIRFVDADEGRTLNRTFRDKDYATNVLTFPYEAADRGVGGVEADLVVCMPVVIVEARAQCKEVSAHCAHLVVHGTLHACGYDHDTPTDADAMEALERAVLARFHIADPYAATD